MDQHQFEQRFRQVVTRLNTWHKSRDAAPAPQPAAAAPDAARRATRTRPKGRRGR